MSALADAAGRGFVTMLAIAALTGLIVWAIDVWEKRR